MAVGDSWPLGWTTEVTHDKGDGGEATVWGSLVVNFGCQLDILGRGDLSCRIASIRLAVGMSVGHFPDGYLIQEGLAYCGQGHPWAGGI